MSPAESLRFLKATAIKRALKDEVIQQRTTVNRGVLAKTKYLPLMKSISEDFSQQLQHSGTSNEIFKGISEY